jgi:uncharacterized protein
MSEPAYDPRYLEGIEHFNKCDFFEAHEVWEDVWKDTVGTSRTFFKGLIHVAVCLHHFGNGNIRGAKKLYISSRGYLEPFAPKYLGLDLNKLLSELEVCCRDIMASQEQFPKVDIVPDLIPEIHLQ